MRTYCEKVTELAKRFRRIDIQAIKRELNTKADGLTKGATYGEYEKKKKLTTLNDYLTYLRRNIIEEIIFRTIIEVCNKGGISSSPEDNPFGNFW